eukprot:857807-Rhodomonas_salina.2
MEQRALLKLVVLGQIRRTLLRLQVPAPSTALQPPVLPALPRHSTTSTNAQLTALTTAAQTFNTQYLRYGTVLQHAVRLQLQ